MNTSAFVPSGGSVVARVSTFTGQQATSPVRRTQPAYSSVSRVVTRAAVKEETRFNKLESDRSAKLASEYRGPQGFTKYAEKVNGRLAQLGFVIGLITEIASGKGINEQILIMFSPLTSAVASALQGHIG